MLSIQNQLNQTQYRHWYLYNFSNESKNKLNYKQTIRIDRLQIKYFIKNLLNNLDFYGQRLNNIFFYTSPYFVFSDRIKK